LRNFIKRNREFLQYQSFRYDKNEIDWVFRSDHIIFNIYRSWNDIAKTPYYLIYSLCYIIFQFFFIYIYMCVYVCVRACVVIATNFEIQLKNFHSKSKFAPNIFDISFISATVPCTINQSESNQASNPAEICSIAEGNWTLLTLM